MIIAVDLQLYPVDGLTKIRNTWEWEVTLIIGQDPNQPEVMMVYLFICIPH